MLKMKADFKISVVGSFLLAAAWWKVWLFCLSSVAVLVLVIRPLCLWLSLAVLGSAMRPELLFRFSFFFALVWDAGPDGCFRYLWVMKFDPWGSL